MVKRVRKEGIATLMYKIINTNKIILIHFNLIVKDFLMLE